MKKQYGLNMIITLPVLLFWSSSNAATESGYPTVQQTTIYGVIIFCLLVFILAILAFWLLKNSSKLKSIEQAEPDGPEWINKHLNDLETHQLDKLISRARVNNEVNNLKINKKTML